MTSQTHKTKAEGPLMKTGIIKTGIIKTGTIKTTTVIKTAALPKTAPAIRPTPVMRPKTSQLSQATKIARRDRIVLEHLPLVKAIAVRVHENLPVHVDLDDLVHAGVLGLFDAASKFNPDKQVAFSSYAKHRIKGAILDSLRQLDWASRDLGAGTNKWKPPRASCKLRCSARHRIGNRAQAGRGCRSLAPDDGGSAQRRFDFGFLARPEHDDLPAPDFPSKPETQPDNMCSHEQMRSVSWA
jgi:RNA polymerase sigma factor (sigma-70 family)